MNLYGQSVSSTAANLYTVLCSLSRTSAGNGYTDQRGVYVFASRRKLGEYIERSERTAQRAVKELKAAGLVFVRRMGLHSNDRIYIVNLGGSGEASSGSNGRSKHVNNGRSEINYKSNNFQDTSIYPVKMPGQTAAMTAAAADDSKMPMTSEQIGAPEAEKMQDKPQTDSKKGETPRKGKPTPKRQRMTKAEKEAAKAKYRAILSRRLKLDSAVYDFCGGLEDEYNSLNALCDLISDAMSARGQQIKVNGSYLTPDQYWHMVQQIENNSNLTATLDRIKAAEVCGNVRNTRAYTLAAVYNAVQWDVLSKGLQPSLNDLYRFSGA